jgi:hypothetical protein
MVYIRRSPDREREFKSCQQSVSDNEAPIYLIIIDGGVRWNSTAIMIERAIHLRNAIELYQSRYQKADDGYDLTQSFLTADDWYVLAAWLQLLQDFKVLCETEEKRASQSRGYHGLLCGVASGLSYMYDLIDKALEKMKDDAKLRDHHHYKAGLLAAQMKLTKYFKLMGQSDLYYTLIALYLAWRTRWF